MTSRSDNLLYVQDETSSGSCGCYCGDEGKSCGGESRKLKWGGPGDGGWLASRSGERVSEQATEGMQGQTTTTAQPHWHLFPHQYRSREGHSRNNMQVIINKKSGSAGAERGWTE